MKAISTLKKYIKIPLSSIYALFGYFLNPSSELKKYFANTTWVLVEKLIRIVLYFIIGVWIVRYLGPTQYGFLTYSQSIIYFFIGVASLGLDEIVVRELVKKDAEINKILGTAFLLKFIISIFLLSSIFLIIIFLGNQGKASQMILVLGLAMVFLPLNIINFYFQYKVMLRYTSIANIGAIAITCLIKVYLILYEYDVIYFAIIQTIEIFLLSLFLLYFFELKGSISIFSLKFDKNMGVRFLKDSWPLIFTGIFINIYMKIDQIMITQFLGATENGIYSAAILLSEGFYFIPLVICLSIFPKILHAKDNQYIYTLRLKRLYFLMIWLAFSIAVVITLSSNFLVLSFFGSAYEDSIKVLIIHIWTCVFVFIGVANSKYLIAENLQKYYFFNTMFGAIINVILNYAFLASYGVVVAAWSSLISYAFASYICLFFFKQTRLSFYDISKSFISFPKA